MKLERLNRIKCANFLAYHLVHSKHLIVKCHWPSSYELYHMAGTMPPAYTQCPDPPSKPRGRCIIAPVRAEATKVWG